MFWKDIAEVSPVAMQDSFFLQTSLNCLTPIFCGQPEALYIVCRMHQRLLVRLRVAINWVISDNTSSNSLLTRLVSVAALLGRYSPSPHQCLVKASEPPLTKSTGISTLWASVMR